MFRHTKFRLPFWSPLLPVAAVLGYAMLAHGCANTTTPPSGGPKDTIPPVLKKVEPLPAMVNVSASKSKTKLRFTFNEYVKVKDAKGTVKNKDFTVKVPVPSSTTMKAIPSPAIRSYSLRATRSIR